jgi:hypothetical protein
MEAQPPEKKAARRQNTPIATGASVLARTPESEFKVRVPQCIPRGIPERNSVVSRNYCRVLHRRRNIAVHLGEARFSCSRFRMRRGGGVRRARAGRDFRLGEYLKAIICGSSRSAQYCHFCKSSATDIALRFFPTESFADSGPEVRMARDGRQASQQS